MVESNGWKCGQNVGICVCVRCFKSGLSTLAMLFRGLSLSECMLGSELKLDFSSKRREGFREL